MRPISFLTIFLFLLTAIPAFAGPGVRGIMRAGNRCLPSVLHEVTLTTTATYDVLSSYYVDACLQNPGAAVELNAGGGGGAYGTNGAGYNGDKVVDIVGVDNYEIYVGQGGDGGSSIGATVYGGAGYANGANATDMGAGAGSSAILDYEETTVFAQAKGGNGAGGASGGGTSTGGTVTPQGGAAGGAISTPGANGNPGSDGSVVIRYYTAP